MVCLVMRYCRILFIFEVRPSATLVTCNIRGLLFDTSYSILDDDTSVFSKNIYFPLVFNRVSTHFTFSSIQSSRQRLCLSVVTGA